MRDFAIKKSEAILNLILFGGRDIDSFVFHYCSLFLFVSTQWEQYSIGQKRHNGYEWSHAPSALLACVFCKSRASLFLWHIKEHGCSLTVSPPGGSKIFLSRDPLHFTHMKAHNWPPLVGHFQHGVCAPTDVRPWQFQHCRAENCHHWKWHLKVANLNSLFIEPPLPVCTCICVFLWVKLWFTPAAV